MKRITRQQLPADQDTARDDDYTDAAVRRCAADFAATVEPRRAA